jgi:hypothetical protein
MAFDKDSNNLFNCYRLIVEQSVGIGVNMGGGQNDPNIRRIYWPEASAEDRWRNNYAEAQKQIEFLNSMIGKYISGPEFKNLPAAEQYKKLEGLMDEYSSYRNLGPAWKDTIKEISFDTNVGYQNGKLTSLPDVNMITHNINNLDEFIRGETFNGRTPDLQNWSNKHWKTLPKKYNNNNNLNDATAVGNLSRQEENEIRTKVDNAQDVTRNEQGQLVVKSTGKLLKDIPTKTTSRRYGSNDAAANASNANTPPPNSSSASPAPFSSAASIPAPVAAKPQTPSIVGASMSALANSPAVKPFSNLNTPNILGQAASNAAQAVYNSPQMTPVRTAANAVRDIYGAYANNSQRQIASQSGYDNQNPAFKE